MSNSKLVNKYVPANPAKYSKGRNANIIGIVIHHAVALNLASVDRTFQDSDRICSAHYGVCDNEIHQYVDEADMAWHCSNQWGNNHTIGIEMCNSSLGGDYPVSDATFRKTAELMADIAKRNNLGKLEYLPDGDGEGVTAHRDWQGAATACPGNYVYSRIKELVAMANEINYPTKKAIEWVKTGIDGGNYETLAGAKLVNLETGNVVKTYSEGVKLDLAEAAVVNGIMYVRTKYSASKGINNGFDLAQLKCLDVVTPEEPEKLPEVSDKVIEEIAEIEASIEAKEDAEKDAAENVCVNTVIGKMEEEANSEAVKNSVIVKVIKALWKILTNLFK